MPVRIVQEVDNKNEINMAGIFMHCRRNGCLGAEDSCLAISGVWGCGSYWRDYDAPADGTGMEPGKDSYGCGT